MKRSAKGRDCKQGAGSHTVCTELEQAQATDLIP